MKLQKIRIGDLLVEKKIISMAQLKVALEEQKKLNEKLGNVLIKLGYVDEETLLKTLADQLKLKVVKAEDIQINPELRTVLPENRAKKLQILPIKLENNDLHVATTDPTNLFALDEAARITGKNIIPNIISTEDFILVFSRLYGTGDKLYQLAKNIEEKILEIGADDKFLEKLAEDTPAIQLVDNIIYKAIKEKASDIHIEPDEDILRIRFRIDGILQEILTINKILYSPLISRVKILSNMNIAEKRIPQDGRFKVSFEEKEVDFRVSTLPTSYGEKVVLRVLDKSKELLDLTKLGIDQYNLKIYESIVEKPYGIILISGPTGSGKTTTLYATLNKLNSMEKNIITVEDPIEYKFKLINQVQVDEKADLTFANALRSILRQDPDIIMIGEIRDKETAEIAIQASLTGHLVLSTIHTNDAVSSVTRLIDMGIENFLVSSSVIGVGSQRLVRKICESCKVEYTPEKEVIERLGINTNNISDIKFYRGTGCNECSNSGYKGRISIFEVLKITKEVKEAINRNESIAAIKDIAIEQGFKPMFKNGMELALKGITTIEEIMRVTVIEQD